MHAVTDETPAAPTLMQAFWYWLRLGFISFGGPAGQISIMHQDLVEKRRWISEKRFLHALNYCMLLPGPEAQQLATYIGWLMHGVRGGLVAGGLFVLPSLFILIVLSYIYMRFTHLPIVAGMLYGIKPAVVAIVLFAAYRIGTRMLNNSALWAISVLSFLAISVVKLPFPIIIICAALLGFISNQYFPTYFVNSIGHKATDKKYGKAVIDDDTSTPAHAVFSKHRLARVILIGIAIWLIAIMALILIYGANGALTHMAWFFTKAALLTFGGAYAVLPYVYQGAVLQYAWLTPTQMMDGLALGETTPGPLIMVVVFVGFVGGWGGEVSAHPVLGGILAAGIVTFFTFLPSFLLIFAGAPFIESTKNNLKLGAPLVAITAAVVGVIGSLALFFARHVFWDDANATLDWLAIFVAVIGFVALLKFNVSVIKLLAACASFGVLHQWLMQ